MLIDLYHIPCPTLLDKSGNIIGKLVTQSTANVLMPEFLHYIFYFVEWVNSVTISILTLRRPTIGLSKKKLQWSILDTFIALCFFNCRIVCCIFCMVHYLLKILFKQKNYTFLVLPLIFKDFFPEITNEYNFFPSLFNIMFAIFIISILMHN